MAKTNLHNSTARVTSSETYFIKPGYEVNTPDRATSQPSGNYWSDARIRSSMAFQYHVYQKAKDLIKGRGLHTVLEVGCGPGRKFKRLIWPHCDDSVLIDVPSCAPLIETILPKATFIGVDLETVSLALGRQFDLIVCADVVEHLANPDSCLRFMHSHLAPSGYCVVSTPERDLVRGMDSCRPPNPAHVREWNRQEFATLLQSRGFRIIEHSLYPQRAHSKICFTLTQRLRDRLLPIEALRTLNAGLFGTQVVICQRSAVQ
jgi:SAM-dependent methyltransferase